MKFPLILVCVFVGAMLVFGGTLLGSEPTRGFGYTLWIASALLVLYWGGRFVLDAWREWRAQRYFANVRKRSATPTTRYSHGSGLR